MSRYNEVQTLTAEQAISASSFGVSLDYYQNRLVVGADTDSYLHTGSGRAYVLTCSQNRSWEVIDFLIPTIPRADVGFGYSVATSGSWIAVGAPFWNLVTSSITTGSTESSGSVYLYVSTGSFFTGSQQLISTGAAPYNFGNVLAFKGDCLFIADTGYTTGSIDNSGVVYYATCSAGVWGLCSEIKSYYDVTNGAFGSAIFPISETRVLIGAPNAIGANAGGVETGVAGDGRIFVFIRTASLGGLYDQYIGYTPAEALNQRANFGYSISANSSYIVVGAPEYGGTSVGRVYVLDSNTNVIQELTSSTAVNLGRFGNSVAINENNVIAVSAPGENSFSGSGVSEGALYLFELVAGGASVVWGETNRLFGSSYNPTKLGNGNNNILVSGSSFFVGAQGPNPYVSASEAIGVVYRFVPDVVSTLQKFTSTGGPTNEKYGYSSAIFGDYAIVGSWNSTKAHTYRFETGSWGLYQTLSSSVAATGFGYGRCVDICGNFAGCSELYNNVGRIYVYENTGSYGLAQIVTSSAASPNEFGSSSFSLTDDVLVGYDTLNGGDIYLFTRYSGSMWNQVQTITYPTSTPEPRVKLGNCGSTLFVGNPSSNYIDIYWRSGNTWNWSQRLEYSSSFMDERFGMSLDATGSYLIASAPGPNVMSGSEIILFARPEYSSTYYEVQRFQGSDISFSQIGATREGVRFAGNTIVVGDVYKAHGRPSGSSGFTGSWSPGSVTLYTLNQDLSLFEPTQKIRAFTENTGSAFGYSIATNGRHIFVGAWDDPNNGQPSSGSVYTWLNTDGTMDIYGMRTVTDPTIDSDFTMNHYSHLRYQFSNRYGDLPNSVPFSLAHPLKNLRNITSSYKIDQGSRR